VSDNWLSQIPSQFFSAIPYLLTLFVLAFFGGRAAAPAADGQPYEKESADEDTAPSAAVEPTGPQAAPI
jgi:hypothetical protein